MIRLTTHQIPRFDRLKSPPSHAVCASISVAWSPDSSAAVYVSADFHFGAAAVDQAFVVDPSHGTVSLRIPAASAEAHVPAEAAPSVLAKLFGSSPGKAHGDIRRADIEAVAALYHPELLGTVE